MGDGGIRGYGTPTASSGIRSETMTVCTGFFLAIYIIFIVLITGIFVAIAIPVTITVAIAILSRIVTWIPMIRRDVLIACGMRVIDVYT